MSFLNRLSASFSSIGQFWQEKNNGLIFRWNLLFIAVQIALLFFKFNDLPPQVPIFYSEPWGESQLGSSAIMFLLPAFSAVILIINNSVAVSFLKTIPLFSRLLVVVSLLFSAFSAITLYQIISLIT